MIIHDLSNGFVGATKSNFNWIGGGAMYAQHFFVGSSPTPVITLVAWCLVCRLTDPFLDGESLMPRVKGFNNVQQLFQVIGMLYSNHIRAQNFLYGKWKLESSKQLRMLGSSWNARGFLQSSLPPWKLGHSRGLHSQPVANGSPTVTREAPRIRSHWQQLWPFRWLSGKVWWGWSPFSPCVYWSNPVFSQVSWSNHLQ